MCPLTFTRSITCGAPRAAGCCTTHRSQDPTIRFLESQCSCTRCRVGVTYCVQGIGLCASGTGAHAAGASHFAAILIPALAPSLHSRIPTSAIRVSHGGATAAQSEAASAVLWVTDHRESTCRCGRVLHAKRPRARWCDHHPLCPPGARTSREKSVATPLCHRTPLMSRQQFATSRQHVQEPVCMHMT